MKICVIGAGASGLICAGIASQNGHDVTILEKNEKIGKKIYITGKGRCNVTNFSNNEEFLQSVISNPKFLMSSLYNFSTYELMGLIEDFGTPLKVERGNRVFPESDKSSDIIKALSKFIEKNNVNLKLNTKVEAVKKQGDKFLIKTVNENYIFDKVVIATGGMSYKSTGSTGDGYKFAKSLNHNIVDLVPGLSPMILKDSFCKNIEGLSLKNITLKAVKNNKILFEEFGEMCFTKNGITGPIVLTLTSKINRIVKDINLYLDFKPALENQKLENRLLREFSNNKNKNLNNILPNLLPKNFVPIFLKVANIDGFLKANSVTQKMRNKILNLIKNFPLQLSQIATIDNAIITAGGINTLEINPKTMESKIVKNLYFCGEIIDVDALTGGYNLQIAFSTGYTAGINL